MMLLELAALAPQLIKWATGNDKAEQVAQIAVDVAKKVTGTESSNAAIAQLRANPDLVISYQQAIAGMQADLEKAYLADVSSARQRDAAFISTGSRNYRADAMFVLAVAVIVALTWMIWKDQDTTEFVKGVFTLVLGRFLGYLDSIYNFEFGTTRGSQAKDTTINNLTKPQG